MPSARITTHPFFSSHLKAIPVCSSVAMATSAISSVKIPSITASALPGTALPTVVNSADGLPTHRRDQRIWCDSLVNLLDGFLIMVDCSIPQIAGLTVQNILFEPFPERLLIREAHPDFLHGFSQKNAKTGSTSSAFSCGRCASCLCLMKNQVLEPWKDKPCGFPSYFRLSATATATATVAPTIGLLPMPRKPIIST